MYFSIYVSIIISIYIYTLVYVFLYFSVCVYILVYVFIYFGICVYMYCRRFILSELLFVLIIVEPWIRLCLGSSLGLEPITLCGLFILSSL